ncbi:winged helix DNA-binding domain-containing protein [Nitriliruptor alkaliphilus]|uniref:winged helix DNA-binding domain-containing protein n=1 Tax=Nitriliruptor alkaliphilus TaxID=427918 RepID=UPI0009FA6A7F|nr:winged helix DNA-binding domain-containing protein [Nitriliruptor alkaliphilus]
MPAVPRVTDAQRRARLVRRHHLDGSAADAVAAVAAVIAMHASDPATPFLGVRARVAGVTRNAIAAPLYEDRTLWRLHAVRRTLFVATVADAVVLEAAAGRDVAARERRRLEGWLAAELGADAVPGWLEEAATQVLAVLADGVPRATTGLTAAVPALATEVTLGSGRWVQRAPVSSRLLFVLAMEGVIVRAAPAGTWRSSQYRWADTERWFGSRPARIEDPGDGRAALTGRYLATHGPATLTDLRWWSGWTARQATAALTAVDARAVTLEDGGEAWILPGDEVATDPDQGGVVTLLPALDPTPMGWKQRDWYLGAVDGVAATQLYDRNGNVGPTVWLDGRVVGGWAVRGDGTVVHRLLEDVGADAAAAVEREAAALTTWLAGTPVTPRFRTPLERELTA